MPAGRTSVHTHGGLYLLSLMDMFFNSFGEGFHTEHASAFTEGTLLAPPIAKANCGIGGFWFLHEKDEVVGASMCLYSTHYFCPAQRESVCEFFCLRLYIHPYVYIYIEACLCMCS